MNNLRNTIKILFKKTKPEMVLSEYSKGIGQRGPLSYLPNKRNFTQNDISSGFSHYTYDEVNNIYSLLTNNWMNYDKEKNPLSKSIFNVLLLFSDTVLIEKENEPFVKFSELLRWRDLALNLGEDIFTCSYFAYHDLFSRKNRRIFSWKPIISTDNTRLKNILKKGVAENHFHLAGSAPHFNISWINLMNHPVKYKKTYWSEIFKKLENEGLLSEKILFSIFKEFNL